MKEPNGPGGFSRGLSVAGTPLEVLRAWASAAKPAADLVAVVDPVVLSPSSVLRYQAGEWISFSFPPVHLDRVPPYPSLVSLTVGRREAVEDLLFSLGFSQLLILPLEPRTAGALLLARVDGTYSPDELAHLVESAAPLGETLAGLARRRHRETASTDSAREVGVLFDLARELSSVSSALQAAQVAATSLNHLMQPVAGALVIAVGGEEPPVALAWPRGRSGDEAVARAAASAGLAIPERVVHDGLGLQRALVDVVWLAPSQPGPVGMALAFDGPVPESAQRVVGSVAASLRLAADRMTVQRQREEDRLRDVVEGLPQGIALLSPDGRIRLWNAKGRATLETLGAWAGEGGRIERIASADLARLAAEARRGQPATAEIYLPAGGRTFEIQVVPAGAAGPATDALESLVVIEDVTDARRQKAQLSRSEKLSALGVLISGIVHEINNPLATILGYTQMLATSPQAAQRERWLRTLEDEARRCQRIVGNLLAFARPQEPGRRTISLAAIAEKALSLVAYPFRSAGIEAVLQASPETPAVHADPDGILQVLINLLTNALHAMEGHGQPRQVLVEIAPGSEGFVTLAIRDTGPGIPPEHLDRVFDPFFTTKPEGKGTGLGLSLVSATIRDHGGQIEVESVPGRGARFLITLPIGTPSPARSEAEPERKPAAMRSALAGLRIVVADDEPAVGSLIAEVLEQAGAHADVYKDGVAARSAILANPPDVIVWDLSLAGVPGRALLEELARRDPQLLRRVILVTGDMVPNAGVEAPDGTACPVLTKPFDLAAVLQTVVGVAGIRVQRTES